MLKFVWQNYVIGLIQCITKMILWYFTRQYINPPSHAFCNTSLLRNIHLVPAFTILKHRKLLFCYPASKNKSSSYYTHKYKKLVSAIWLLSWKLMLEAYCFLTTITWSIMGCYAASLGTFFHYYRRKCLWIADLWSYCFEFLKTIY